MWKKIGAIGPTSNDNKSSRSKDENAYEPFSQMSKLRMNQSQMQFQQNEYFCPNYLGKKKNSDGKYLSQSRIQTPKQLQHAKSYKQIPNQYNGKLSTIKKKGINQQQAQQFKNRMSQQLLQQMNNSLQKDQKNGQQNMRQTQSTQMICSQTSLDNNMRKLKQCRSTPQFNLAQIGSITQEIPLDKKIETQKNLQSLRKQHAQIKKAVKNEFQEFKRQFNSMQKQLNNKISSIMAIQNKQKMTLKNQNLKNGNNMLKFDQVMFETKKFGEKMKHLNDKKAQIMEKYMSLRVK